MFGKIEDKANEVAGKAEEKYGEFTDDYVHQVKGAAQKVVSQSSQAAQDAANVVRDRVEGNPFVAISISAGVGLLLGLLIGRKEIFMI
ncbi:CsbD family protein [Rouxiella badensis]|uniref:CsbD family protein n=2 Tax=Rouxiella badensis TaxID=1646377 RepID=UPI001787E64A|nr:CsbD family protein [Rouxiella badensis]MCC3704846.1 CsbD family protein [Rouxiella badensis]QOI55685.1 CsbD family protein [Rouxiella badensis subsp. acadiensis]